MEHRLRLANSNSLFYASVFVFTFGLILWLAWARFFHERDAFKRFSQFVMLLAAQMLCVGGFASVVTNGLDGVACAAGRYSMHLVCHSHDESPVWFWVVAVWLAGRRVLLRLVALLLLLQMVVPDQRYAVEEGAVSARPTTSTRDNPLVVRGGGRRVKHSWSLPV